MVRDLDAEYLEELRANADQVRADIAERERLLEEDPLLAHDGIMRARMPMPRIVHKRYNNEPTISRRDDMASPPDNGDTPLLNDELLDAIAAALVEVKNEMRDEVEATVAPLRERIITLEAQLSTLLALFGNNNSRSLIRCD
jgi:hypothetical protein